MTGYLFIYAIRCFFTYNFWALGATFLSSFALFFGHGKQMVYHKLVKHKNLDFGDKSKKQRLWLTGQIFYGLAWPLAITSAMMYFIPFQKLAITEKGILHSVFDST